MQDKYQKQIIGSFTHLYNINSNSSTEYSMDEYEQFLLNHLEKVKEECLKLTYKTPGLIGDVKIVIKFETDWDGKIYNNSCLKAYRPMTEFEKSYVDNVEKFNFKREEEREKVQLANLLAKYPDFKMTT